MDGLRGLAVVGVLVFHGGYLQGGYLGVDAFFVLSGFLITSLLLVEAAGSGGVSLGRFWGRRARRLLPALACVLGFVALYAWVWAQPSELATIRGDAIATLLYVANWHQIATSNDYFALFRSPSPLDHTWSLAIEEQFYVVWPLVIWLVVRARGRGSNVARRVLGVCCGLAVGSVVWAQFAYRWWGATRVYYGTDTRASAILFGAALAAWLIWRGPLSGRHARVALEVVAVAAFVGVGVAWVVLPGTSPVLYEGGLALCGLGVAAVIAAAVHPERGVVFWVLSWRPLRAMGLISYGVYLWHWPLFVVLDSDRVHLTGLALFGVRVAVTMVVAIGSYRLIERPIRYGFGRPFAMLAAVPVVATVLVIAIITTTSAVPATEQIAGGPGTGGVMVVGDSVARSLVAGLQQVGIPATNRTVVGCSFLPGIIEAYGNTSSISCGPLRAYVAQQRPKYVLLVSGIFETLDLRVTASGPMLRPGTAAYASYYESSIQAAIDALSSTGATVVIPTVPCIHGNFLPAKERDQTVDNVARLNIEDSLLHKVATRPDNRTRVVSPDLRGYLCPRGTFQASLGSVKVMRPDGEHFSIEGARAVGRWLIAQVPGMKSAPHGRASEADSLVSKLTAGGVYCSFAAPLSASNPINPAASVSCAKRGNNFLLRVYRTARAKARYIGLSVAVTCEFQHSATIPVTYAAEADWVVTGNPAAVRLAAQLLAGKVVTTRC
ncbi:MAG TPA: acyltransferase family protein [Acidimicrobiia bacterium]